MDINSRDASRDTPLAIATCWGSQETMESLLASGGKDSININLVDSDSLTPFDCVEHEGIVQLLRAAGGRTGEELWAEARRAANQATRPHFTLHSSGGCFMKIPMRACPSCSIGQLRDPIRRLMGNGQACWEPWFEGVVTVRAFSAEKHFLDGLHQCTKASWITAARSNHLAFNSLICIQSTVTWLAGDDSQYAGDT
ncbi:hypothetical protein BD779DRAFT_635892 [Infundibulicybe gibba]|nr:hypothetical protein BD779DRAFT_635892 [Infundibulicybe gibba]